VSPDAGVVGSNVNMPPEALGSSARQRDEKDEWSWMGGVWFDLVLFASAPT